MRRNKLLLAFLLINPASSYAADAWIHLKAGMTRDETLAVLGGELMASKGRGFEVAVYDNRAEVVFLNGQVVSWTAPAHSQAAPAPANTFRFEQVARPQPQPAAVNRPSETRRARAILPAYRW